MRKISHKEKVGFFLFLFLLSMFQALPCYGFMEVFEPKLNPLAIASISTHGSLLTSDFEYTNLIQSDSLNLNRNNVQIAYQTPFSSLFTDYIGIDYRQAKDYTQINASYNLTLIQQTELIELWGNKSIGLLNLTYGIIKSTQSQFSPMLPFSIQIKPLADLELGVKRTLTPLTYSIHYYSAEDSRDEYATFPSFEDAPKYWLTYRFSNFQLALHYVPSNYIHYPTADASTHFTLDQTQKYRYGFSLNNTLKPIEWTFYGQMGAFYQDLNVVVDGEPYGELRHNIEDPFLGIQFHFTNIDDLRLGYEWTQIKITEGVITPVHADLLRNVISNTIYDYSNIQAQFHHFFVAKQNLWGLDWNLQYSFGRTEGSIYQKKTVLFYPEEENEIVLDIKRMDYLRLSVSKCIDILPDLSFQFSISQTIPLQIQKSNATTTNVSSTSLQTASSYDDHRATPGFLTSSGTTLRFSMSYTGWNL